MPSGLQDDKEGALLNLNVSQILSMLNSLSPHERQSLLDLLGITNETEIYNLLEQDKMHIKSYEQQLMVYPEFRLNKILLLYVPPILIILGTFGNIFSFIILKRKAMLKFSTYFHLMVLAIADTFILYIGLLRLWVGELTGYDLRDKADWLCKLINMLGYTISDFSVWLIITVTIERYIVVCHPLQANSMCNTPRARKVILGLFVGLAILNMHFFWTVKIVYHEYNGEKIPQCGGAEPYKALVSDAWPWVDAFVYSFLPFIIIMALNGLIIRQVILAHKQRTELQHVANHMYEQRRPSHEGSTRLTVMLLTISFAFLLTTLPMNIVNIATGFWNQMDIDLHQVSKFRLARTITELLMYVNHSMNFFLYCATGQKFRHQLVWMICYAKRSYNLSWGSEPSQNTRLESIRTLCAKTSTRNQSDGNEVNMYATIKSEMYTPLKYYSVLDRNSSRT